VTGIKKSFYIYDVRNICETYETQENLANGKVSARQHCVYEGS